MKIYLGLSISGRSYDDVVSELSFKKGYFEELGYEVLSPMTGKSYLRTEVQFKAQGYHNPVSTNHAIYERDIWMVHQSDILFMDFSNSKDVTSIGMIAELSVGAFLRKHTVCVIPDTNIHNHAFILEMADIVFKSVDEAYEYFGKLVAQEI
jgi:hypothetical protein